MEAHEAVLATEVDKAHRRLSVKHLEYEETKLRAAQGRKQRKLRDATAKAARKQALMTAKREELRRQHSEQ